MWWGWEDVWDMKQGGAGGEQFNAGASDIERKE